MKKAYYQLHLAVFLAGLTGILGRLITLDAGVLVWYRLMFTAITMWFLFGATKKIHSVTLSEKLKIMGVGILASSHWLFFYASIKYANVSVSLVCFSLVSFFTALLEPVLIKKKLDRLELLLGIITLVGVYVIFQFDAQYKLGIVLGVISALLAAVFPIFNRELLRKTNVESLLAWQQTGGFLFISLLLPFYHHYIGIHTIIPNWSNFLWLLVLSWVCSVWAFQLSAGALKKLTAFTVNLTFSLEPVYGILLAFAVYREDQFLSKWFFIGFAIIILALLAHVYLLFGNNKQTKTQA
jgi:drug/metabolite transporter (DMT)-like permease